MVLFFPRNVLRHQLNIYNIPNFQRIWKDSSPPSAPLLAPFNSPPQHFGSGATNLFACLHLFHHHRPIFHRYHHQPDVSRVGQLNWLPLSHFADPGPSCGCSRQAPQSSKTSASSCPRPAWSVHPSFSRLDIVHTLLFLDDNCIISSMAIYCTSLSSQLPQNKENHIKIARKQKNTIPNQKIKIEIQYKYNRNASS